MLKSRLNIWSACVVLLPMSFSAVRGEAQAAPNQNDAARPQTAPPVTGTPAISATQTPAAPAAQGTPADTLAGITFPDAPPAVAPAQKITLAQAATQQQEIIESLSKAPADK